MSKNKIKLKTIYGKILTLRIIEQTDTFVSGLDKYGVFCKIPFTDIENSISVEGDK